MSIKKLDYDGLQTLVASLKDFVRQHAGIPIGTEFFTTNPNVPDGALPLLGGGYLRDLYTDLWDWVQEQNDYLISEDAWQTLYTNQNGNVPFYSTGDGSTTFRVPSLQCWIKAKDGNETIGTYKQAGLPNITGGFDTRATDYQQSQIVFFASGAFYPNNKSTATADSVHQVSGTVNLYDYRFDASRSSAVYGRSSTVVPESIVGLWIVRAYGAIVDTGSIDVERYIENYDDTHVISTSEINELFSSIY